MLVAGAAGGLGREAALACARAGARVVLLGRKVPKLNHVHDAIAAEGGEAALYPLDLEGATPDDYLQLAQRLADAYGRLDGLLHCAAQFPGLTPLEHTDPAMFARGLHVNLTARWWLTQACLPLLKRADDGAVVFAIDAPARTGGAYWGAYGVVQPALESLVAMLHAETASSSLRISGLQPGPMRTPLRARAYADERAAAARDARDYAQACVTLLSTDGMRHRGTMWAPAP
ncbi:SDR family NAD(P)-dependent oxidoreductase [Luteimonas aestuarii]|uniref:SDR family NAD(P)-dependent oxidoreductase n=1 Tax=Luteimonas aestuarii TaxID=453837 RepID=A0A4R5U1V7_9GAMM|nr:SDR family NAD(P)-dependent oxidoreductase [Luteimonas aestuarii]